MANGGSAAPVLVVDDDRLILRMIADVLEEAGATAVCASSFEEARPHLDESLLMAFVDIHLPGEQGDRFCREIRLSERWELPVVMITGSDKHEVIRQCLVAGADDFAPKPLEKHQLLSKLEAVRAPAPAPWRGGAANRRVLIAVHNELFRSLAVRILEKSGHVPIDADRPEAVTAAAAQASSLDAAILEVGFGGEAAAPALRSAREALALHKVPLISVSRGAAGGGLPRSVDAPLVRASLSPYDVELERDEVFRHLNRALQLPAGMSERARRPRVPFHTTVRFRCGDGADWLVGYGFDANEGGIFVRTLTPPPPDRRPVEVTFTLEGLGTFTAKGLVVWNNAFGPRHLATVPYGMGISFTEFPVARWDDFRSYVRARLGAEKNANER